MGRSYSEEEYDWLRTHYNDYSCYAELLKDLNDIFCKNHTVTSLRELCTKRLKIKGYSNPTTYGNKKKEELPIGTIRKVSNGVTYIKVKNVENSVKLSGYEEPYWKPIQKKVWEDYHKKEVPKGKMVCFLDCNRDNIDISNLYCIDRKISAVMSKNKWWSKDKDRTLTAIRWCELYYALHGGKSK